MTKILSSTVKEDLGNGEYVVEMRIKIKPFDANDIITEWGPSNGNIARRPMMMLAPNEKGDYCNTTFWDEPVLKWEGKRIIQKTKKPEQ